MPIDKSLKVLELDKKILVELNNAGIDFVFKGGTSLHLKYPDKMKRISQDTDIAISKENFQETISSIVTVLEGMGLTIEKRSEDGDYGAVYRIDDNKGTLTRLDIATYLEFEKIRRSPESVTINGVEIKMFDPYITFIEKLLAIHSWFTTVSGRLNTPDELTSEQIRKMRHILDVYELITNGIVTIDNTTLPKIKYYLMVAKTNEINGKYFSNIRHLSDLIEFQDDFFEKINHLFNSWDGDDYHDEAVKPDLNQIMELFKTLKVSLSGVVYNED